MKAVTAALASLLLTSATYGAGATVLYSQNFDSFPSAAGSVDGWWDYYGPGNTFSTFGVDAVGNNGTQGFYMTADSSAEIGTDWYFYAGLGRSNIVNSVAGREDNVKFSVDINPQNANTATPVGITLSQYSATLGGTVWTKTWTPTLTANAYNTVSFILNTGTDVPGSNVNGAASVFDPTLPISISAITWNSGGFPLAANDAIDIDNVSLSTLADGDANGDGNVDLTDLSTVLNNFGATASAWGSGNFDGAPSIDLTDLSDVLNNFGTSASAAAPAIAAPEPAAALLLALGTPLMLARRRTAR